MITTIDGVTIKCKTGKGVITVCTKIIFYLLKDHFKIFSKIKKKKLTGEGGRRGGGNLPQIQADRNRSSHGLVHSGCTPPGCMAAAGTH